LFDKKNSQHGIEEFNMKNSKIPQHFRYIIPIVEVLKDLGGSGRAGEVTDLVVEKLNIPEDELNEVISSGQSRVKNQVQWARFMLVKAGYLDASTRGVWSLTEKGLKLELTDQFLLDLYEQRKQMGKEYRKQRKKNVTEPNLKT
jgi:restriction system protein